MSVLNPVQSIEIGGNSVEFRELRAVEGIEFLKRLSKHASTLRQVDGGSLRVDIASLVVGAEDVSRYLVLKSAQKDDKWLEEISASEFLDALQVAIELNITESLVKKALGVAEIVKSRMPSTTPKEVSPAS